MCTLRIRTIVNQPQYKQHKRGTKNAGNLEHYYCMTTVLVAGLDRRRPLQYHETLHVNYLMGCDIKQ